MDNNDIITNVAMEVIKQNANEIYDDAIHPTAKNVGGFFGTVSGFFSNVVVYPLKKLNIEYEQKAIAFEREMQKKYDNIPENHRVEPELHMVGPTMESLKYNIMQDDLAEMFSNLLVSDLDDRTQGLCTPAFVKIIEQLSPADAKVFKSIVNYCQNPSIAIPVCEIKLVVETDPKRYALYTGIPTIVTNFAIFSENENTVSKSIQRLSMLGLVDLNYLKSFNDKSIYENLAQQDFVSRANTVANGFSNDKYIPKVSNKGILVLNDIGIDFAKVCLRKL